MGLSSLISGLELPCAFQRFNRRSGHKEPTVVNLYRKFLPWDYIDGSALILNPGMSRGDLLTQAKMSSICWVNEKKTCILMRCVQYRKIGELYLQLLICIGPSRLTDGRTSICQLFSVCCWIRINKMLFLNAGYASTKSKMIFM